MPPLDQLHDVNNLFKGHQEAVVFDRIYSPSSRSKYLSQRFDSESNQVSCHRAGNKHKNKPERSFMQRAHQSRPMRVFR